MTLIINTLKLIGLIILTVMFNVIPMLLLQQQTVIPLALKWILGIIYLLIVAISMFFLWNYYQKQQDPAIKNQKMRARDWGYLVLFWFLARVVAILGTVVNQALSGQQMSSNDAALQSLSAFTKGGFPFYTVLFILAMSVIAPVMEELAFRGIPMVLLFKGKSVIWGAVVTSLVFAALHATNIIELILYGLMGLIFFMAYQRRGLLLDSVLLHIANNFPIAIYLLLTGMGII
ncbi:CPBP family intramembrane glutamic endopeptidase [Streptococcus phocae subsp. salmonis]|uniref:CPBP family intramembrane glutamic endopeptidase n=1 Tax=Streptococcus phocae TaxID=119224 RepID=UPI000531D1DE|nr:type II CAAX endopeptidase family protein [Streptococcus phocae]KGR72951.1 CAAX protease [Streptococcus phocae subsp. salmonis]